MDNDELRILIKNPYRKLLEPVLRKVPLEFLSGEFLFMCVKDHDFKEGFNVDEYENLCGEKGIIPYSRCKLKWDFKEREFLPEKEQNPFYSGRIKERPYKKFKKGLISGGKTNRLEITFEGLNGFRVFTKRTFHNLMKNGYFLYCGNMRNPMKTSSVWKEDSEFFMSFGDELELVIKDPEEMNSDIKGLVSWFKAVREHNQGQRFLPGVYSRNEPVYF